MLSVLRGGIHCCRPDVFSILKSLCKNGEMMSCLCSTETTVIVKEIMLDWITLKKIKKDNTWSEERLVLLYSRTKRCVRSGMVYRGKGVAEKAWQYLWV